jgi:hypothetical protein
MASVGSFGIDTPTGNQISRTTTQTAESAVLSNALGQKLEGTTHSSETVVEEEFFTGAALPAQVAVDAQNGASVILSDTINESNVDYAKQTKSTTTYPGAAS